jgi:hypothetical protein
VSAPAPREFRARVGIEGQGAAEAGPVRVDDTGLSAGALRVPYDEIEALARGDLSIALTLFGGPRVIDRGGLLDDLGRAARGFRARVSSAALRAHRPPHLRRAVAARRRRWLRRSPRGWRYCRFNFCAMPLCAVAVRRRAVPTPTPGVTLPVEPGPAAAGAAWS